MDIHYLSVRDVTIIHFMVMKKYGEGEQVGIKEQGLLESAVYRPQQSAFGEDAYVSLWDKAGAFFESLVQNHCFFNGNKRTAFTSLDIFLKKNGYYIIPDTDTNEAFTYQVAERKIHTDEISVWIRLHAVEKR